MWRFFGLGTASDLPHDASVPDEPAASSESVAEPAPAEPAQPTTYLGLPVDMFVKGGTTSSRHDAYVAEQEADAERRRNEEDRIKKIASLPVEQGGGKLFTNYLSPNPEGIPVENPKILLHYLTRAGEQVYNEGKPLKCLADIIVGLDPANMSELTLVLVCPRCCERLPQGQCQIQVRQSNRMWHLDQTKAGELIVFEGRPFRSAGLIMESERFTCPRCTWQAHIDKNRVWPEQ